MAEVENGDRDKSRAERESIIDIHEGESRAVADSGHYRGVDTDRDGVLKDDDECITEPETRNGYDDDDGCPDEIPENVSSGCFGTIIRGASFSGKAIGWRSKRSPSDVESVQHRLAMSYPDWAESKLVKRASALPVSAIADLDGAAGALAEFPQITIEISGHTDEREGSCEEEREAISFARAELARAYLLEVHGVDPLRVVTRAAGASSPVESDDTARAKNRRVDFAIVSRLRTSTGTSPRPRS